MNAPVNTANPVGAGGVETGGVPWAVGAVGSRVVPVVGAAGDAGAA